MGESILQSICRKFIHMSLKNLIYFGVSKTKILCLLVCYFWYRGWTLCFNFRSFIRHKACSWCKTTKGRTEKGGPRALGDGFRGIRRGDPWFDFASLTNARNSRRGGPAPHAEFYFPRYRIGVRKGRFPCKTIFSSEQELWYWVSPPLFPTSLARNSQWYGSFGLDKSYPLISIRFICILTIINICAT